MEMDQITEDPFFTYKEETQNILVEVQPFYIEERSIPEQDHYFYAYKVKISNRGLVKCQLQRRHWLIRNGKGAQKEVEGVGVVGETPEIEPNESYTYTSFCPLDTPTGNMRGNFLFTNDYNEKFSVMVPLFFFRTPESFKSEPLH